MSLAAGTRLGPHEILSLIGEGGMGEVYKAKDTRLDRTVAIKVLPEHLADNPERKARFEREAKAISQLNHPHICTLYDVGEQDGIDYIIMEYIDGETLAERIARGPIPIDETVAIARQIAEALEAGHEAGVIHRDLKPPNVKLKEDGTIKVLDYGLAKALEGEVSGGADSELSQSPTLAREGTQLGVILGTAAYMSPEQAKGKKVDRRTDLWAFGAVVYEMLTGKRAFAGEDVSDTLAAVLRAEPDWDALPSETPWRIRDLLRRCLRKNPAERLRDASAARLDIEDALDETRQPDAESITHARTHFFSIVAALVAALVAGVGVAIWMKPEPRDVTRLDLYIPPDLELLSNRSAPIISPDGRNVVVRGVRQDGSQLYLRRIDQADFVPISGTAGGFGAFFSPDSQWLAFNLGGTRGTLKKVPLSGGAPVDISDGIYGDRSSWGEDDTIVFTSRDGGLMQVPSSGGTPSVVTTLIGNEFRHLHPHILPGGASVLFTAVSGTAGTETSRTIVVSLDSGERTDLNLSGTNPVYVSSGHLLFARTGTLLAVPFDPASFEVQGDVRSVQDGVSAQVADRETFFSVSRDGTLLFVTGLGDAFRKARLVWVDRAGKQTLASEHVRNYAPAPRLSPDGRRVVVPITREMGADNWILDIGRDVFTRLTFDGFLNGKPLWSPDGTRIFFVSNGASGRHFDIFSTLSDGSADAEQLTENLYRIVTSVSSTSDILIFRQQSDVGSIDRDIGMLRLDDGSEPVLILDSDFAEHGGDLSPDDRWLAYVSDESGEEEVYVRRFPDLNSRLQVSVAGGNEPKWSTDGRELFYRNGSSMMSVAISARGEELEAGRPEFLFEGPYATGHYGGNPGTNYDVAGDGRFLMILPDSAKNPARLHVVLNWAEELKRLVPTGK